MKSLNKVMLIGIAGKHPELRYTSGGTPYAYFFLAVDDSYKNKNTGEWVNNTTWIKCVAWGKLAELIAQMVAKGKMLYVEGKFKFEKEWKGKVNAYVLMETFTMLSPRKHFSSSEEIETNDEDYSSEGTSNESIQEVPF